uniref:ornithine decarboxylase-like n=1 Tax=Jaculus jaculus TaxID=51337 RepID=UPI001E1B01CA|nr:ornithine decarboxylase-like [Jaculus jaculus]
MVEHMDGSVASFMITHMQSTCCRGDPNQTRSSSPPALGTYSDGLDWIFERRNLPEMHVGDGMLFEHPSAYTASPLSGSQRLYLSRDVTTSVATQEASSEAGFPPDVEEQAGSAPLVSCAQERGTDGHLAAVLPLASVRRYYC